MRAAAGMLPNRSRSPASAANGLPPPSQNSACKCPYAPLQAVPQGADVRLEDQQKINTFSRLNTRLHELESQLAAKKVRCCICTHPGT